MRIWQIREHNPNNLYFEQTFIAYEDIVARLSAVDRSMVRLGAWLLVAALAFAALGLGVRRWNRRRALPRG
jgi:hypothetical protein